MGVETAFWSEFASVVTLTVLMVISPGADFAMVTRNSLCYSRQAGLYSSLGIACAIWVHVTYTLAGLGLIISQSPTLFNIIRYAGACYLVYIGVKTFMNRRASLANAGSGGVQSECLSKFEAFKLGFLTNATNPKTTILFVSIFTQVIRPSTSLGIQLIYGAIISFAHLAWFMALALLITHEQILSRIFGMKSKIDALLGVFLICFGVKLAFF